MLPEVETYLSVTDPEAIQTRMAEAREGLKNSDDAFVAFLSRDNGWLARYPHQVRQLLQQLPASQDEINSWGSRQGWGSAWHTLMNEAIAAGVWGANPNRAVEAAAGARADLSNYLDRLVSEYGGTGATVRTRVNELVDALLAESQGTDAPADRPELDLEDEEDSEVA